VLSALVYLLVRAKPGASWATVLGINPAVAPVASGKANGAANGKANGVANGKSDAPGQAPPSATRALLLRYLQCAVFITSAAPFGFAALSYISYPTMVLGKSCKLVPVMLMNVVLYRRRFARHKYVVVALVTAGITLFMVFGNEKAGGKKGKHGAGTGPASLRANLLGTAYLLVNLALDGATNSTQDEIFGRYRVSGQQMMLWINLFGTLLSTVLGALPLPHMPVIHPGAAGESELASALRFVRDHPAVLSPLAQFALTGALGQIFIFETLQHFGSLTLVTITLTRKLFTMALSVMIYNHTLTLGQWFGAAVVFAGISIEAWVKRRGLSFHAFLSQSSRLTCSFPQTYTLNGSSQRKKRPRSRSCNSFSSSANACTVFMLLERDALQGYIYTGDGIIIHM
jgi:UDP-galactose transporter B1